MNYKTRKYKTFEQETHKMKLGINSEFKIIPETHLDIEARCVERFLELKAEYPGQEEFFDSNREELIFAMRDIKSEKELDDIRKFIESSSLGPAQFSELSYSYSSSSFYAQEDLLIKILDLKRFFIKFKDEKISVFYGE